MRSGSPFARPTWERPIDASGSSSCATETAAPSTDSELRSSGPWPSEGGSVAWPTPAAGLPNDGEEPAQWLARREHHASKEEGATRASLPLAVAAKLWPTATATDASSSARHGYMLTGHSGTTLLDAARLWATPMARDAKGPGWRDPARTDPTLGQQVLSHHDLAIEPGGPAGMVLNPSFVEALMGFPRGHTVSARSETQLSLAALL